MMDMKEAISSLNFYSDLLDARRKAYLGSIIPPGPDNAQVRLKFSSDTLIEIIVTDLTRLQGDANILGKRIDGAITTEARRLAAKPGELLLLVQARQRITIAEKAVSKLLSRHVPRKAKMMTDEELPNKPPSPTELAIDAAIERETGRKYDPDAPNAAKEAIAKYQQ